MADVGGYDGGFEAVGKNRHPLLHINLSRIGRAWRRSSDYSIYYY